MMEQRKVALFKFLSNILSTAGLELVVLGKAGKARNDFVPCSMLKTRNEHLELDHSFAFGLFGWNNGKFTRISGTKLLH